MAKGYKAAALPGATHFLLAIMASIDHVSMSRIAASAIEEKALRMLNRDVLANAKEVLASLLLEPLAASLARDGFGVKRLPDGTYKFDLMEPTGPFNDDLDEEGIRL